MSLDQPVNLRINIKGPIARATIRTSAVLVLRLLVQAGTLLIVARMLGPHQFGAFAGVSALAVVLGTLSTFGTNFVLLGEVSRDPARRDGVLRYAVPGTLLCGCLLLVFYLFICMSLFHDARLELRIVLAIGITEMLLQPLFGLPAAEHLGLGRTARSQMLTSLPLLLRLLAAASVYWWRPTDLLGAYASGYLLASMTSLAVATATMRGSWPRLSTWRLPSKTEVRHTIGYALLNVTAVGPAELDKTLATRLLPLASAGVYAAGARVIGAATLPVIAMMLSALPRLFREGQGDPRRTTQLVRWLFAAALGYSIILAAAFWFIAPAFDLLFGEKYYGLAHTVQLLCVAIPGMALRIAAGSILMALGNPWMRVIFELAGLIVLAIAGILLTASLGAAGMPLALTCSEWAMTILGWGFVVANRQNWFNGYTGTRNECTDT